MEIENGGVDREWSMDRLRKDIKFGETITPDQKDRVLQVLLQTKSALSTHDNDIGKAEVTPQTIVLTDRTPIWQKPRRFSEPLNREIDAACKELELQDIVETCQSPWNSPLVPLRKIDGSLRLCVDYRKVNKVTKPDKFPMPNLTDSVYTAHNMNFFSKIDLTKGYYQIPIQEDSRPLTAFSTQHQQYQFRRLSFGLRNSGIQFQRTIQEILTNFDSKKVIVYIDDILIISQTFDEHLDIMQKVLNTLIANGIKIKVDKCEFLKEEVSFLGHVIGKTGIRKSPEFIEKVRDYPKPVTVNQLRRFLGLANFQRKFVDRFSIIAKPLTASTQGSKSKKLIWSEEMNEAFEQIKMKLMEEITLSYPDYSEGASPLEVYADASGVGAGACLKQIQAGEQKIIAYASTTFKTAEQHYAPYDRELPALR